MLRVTRSEVCNETEMMACGRDRFSSLEMPTLDCNCSFFHYHVFEIRISGLLKVARMLFVGVA